MSGQVRSGQVWPPPTCTIHTEGKATLSEGSAGLVEHEAVRAEMFRDLERWMIDEAGWKYCKVSPRA